MKYAALEKTTLQWYVIEPYRRNVENTFLKKKKMQWWIKFMSNGNICAKRKIDISFCVLQEITIDNSSQYWQHMGDAFVACWSLHTNVKIISLKKLNAYYRQGMYINQQSYIIDEDQGINGDFLIGKYNAQYGIVLLTGWYDHFFFYFCSRIKCWKNGKIQFFTKMIRVISDFESYKMECKHLFGPKKTLHWRNSTLIRNIFVVIENSYYHFLFIKMSIKAVAIHFPTHQHSKQSASGN